MEKKIKALKKKLNEVLGTCECRTSSIKGVKNLSRSDLETALLYAETMEQNGTWEGVLMRPRCEVADLLSAYGLL